METEQEKRVKKLVALFARQVKGSAGMDLLDALSNLAAVCRMATTPISDRELEAIFESFGI